MDNKDTIRIDPDSGEFSAAEKVGLLQVIRGEDIGREFELKPGKNIIGRQKNCTIHIINNSISRVHAQIDCNPNAPADRRYVISDLDSTNGTRVKTSPAWNSRTETGCSLGGLSANSWKWIRWSEAFCRKSKGS
jgi:hypothetical protein